MIVRRAVAGVVAAGLLVAGCTTTARAPRADADGAARTAAAPQRCSPSDQDRDAWFCVIGQLLYAIVAGMEVGVDLRPK